MWMWMWGYRREGALYTSRLCFKFLFLSLILSRFHSLTHLRSHAVSFPLFLALPTSLARHHLSPKAVRTGQALPLKPSKENVPLSTRKYRVPKTSPRFSRLFCLETTATGLFFFFSFFPFHLSSLHSVIVKSFEGKALFPG